MATVAFIVQHFGGHRYSAWTEPRDASRLYAKRKAAKVVARFGGPSWSILVPDEVVEREIKTTQDWDRLSPETPGVILYTRNGHLCK